MGLGAGRAGGLPEEAWLQVTEAGALKVEESASSGLSFPRTKAGKRPLGKSRQALRENGGIFIISTSQRTLQTSHTNAHRLLTTTC